jgi:Fe-S-cluster containining protein
VSRISQNPPSVIRLIENRKSKIENSTKSYLCQRCTNCCRWPGFVKLLDSDITAISRFLQIPEWDFIQQYTRLRPNRAGLALTDTGTGACIFLHGNACAIQPAKPRQCDGFPSTWNFPGWRSLCNAIPEI